MSADELVESCEESVRGAREQVAVIARGRKDDRGAANAAAARCLKGAPKRSADAPAPSPRRRRLRGLADADKFVKDLERLSKSVPPAQRRAIAEPLERLRRELGDVRNAIQKANDDASKAELMGGRSGPSVRSRPPLCPARSLTHAAARPHARARVLSVALRLRSAWRWTLAIAWWRRRRRRPGAGCDCALRTAGAAATA